MIARIKILGVTIGVALLPVAAPAQEVDCASAEAQVELTYCAEQDWMRADAVLNDAYQVALAVLTSVDAGLEAQDRGAVVNLRNAQRAWITFRDAACAAEGYQMHGGSAEPMVIYGCRARLTEARTADLQAIGDPD